MPSIGLRIDKVTKEMAFVLFKQNWNKTFQLYLQNIRFHLRENIKSYFDYIKFQKFSLERLYFPFILPFLLFFTIILRHRTFRVMSLTVFVLTIANYMITAIVQPLLPRYTLYTDTLQVCMILIMVFIGYRTFIRFAKQYLHIRTCAKEFNLNEFNYSKK